MVTANSDGDNRLSTKTGSNAEEVEPQVVTHAMPLEANNDLPTTEAKARWTHEKTRKSQPANGEHFEYPKQQR